MEAVSVQVESLWGLMWANVRIRYEGQFETASELVQGIWGCLSLYRGSLGLCTSALESSMGATGGYIWGQVQAV